MSSEPKPVDLDAIRRHLAEAMVMIDPEGEIVFDYAMATLMSKEIPALIAECERLRSGAIEGRAVEGVFRSVISELVGGNVQVSFVVAKDRWVTPPYATPVTLILRTPDSSPTLSPLEEK